MVRSSKRKRASSPASKPMKKRAAKADDDSSSEKRSDDEMDVAKSLASLPSSPLQVSKTSCGPSAGTVMSPGLFNDLREINSEWWR